MSILHLDQQHALFIRLLIRYRRFLENRQVDVQVLADARVVFIDHGKRDNQVTRLDSPAPSYRAPRQPGTREPHRFRGIKVPLAGDHQVLAEYIDGFRKPA